ncbi:hypothetical protein [Pantoea agglomerans]|uniref:hypothetical protein n=1 Tax=Enterobacter agglomerans TaxID=549 RepID=UPI0028A2943A|nr:hypothetical protein [Pantoea agglomerans]WNK42334.1 hypothetical protein RM160_21490 [Pantoea agglomerans]
MSHYKKRHSGGKPARKKQVQNVKSYGPFLTYLRSLTFIKNLLIGCVNPGMMAILFYQEQCPGWWYATLLVPITLFPFAILAIERIGLIIAPVRFWQQYHKLGIRHQSGLLVLYHLLITLMVLPLAMIYFIWLRSTNHSS